VKPTKLAILSTIFFISFSFKKTVLIV